METSPSSPGDSRVEISPHTIEMENDIVSVNLEPPQIPSQEVQETIEGERNTDSVNSILPNISGVKHNIGESVDHLLDESHAYKSAVRAAFEQFQLQRPAKELPLKHLLPALQFFIQVCQIFSIVLLNLSSETSLHSSCTARVVFLFFEIFLLRVDRIVHIFSCFDF